MIAYLIALCLFSEDYSGQGSDWYAKGCLAQHYLLKWFQISDPYAWMEATFISEKHKRAAKFHYLKLARKYLQSSPVCWNDVKSRF